MTPSNEIERGSSSASFVGSQLFRDSFVQQHQGTIECDSEPGRTVFRILLPVDLPRTAATAADAS